MLNGSESQPSWGHFALAACFPHRTKTHVFCAHLKLMCFRHVWGTWSISLELPTPHYIQLPTQPDAFDSVFWWFMPRRLISVFMSIHWSYSIQIYFLDCMARFASPTEIKCLFIAVQWQQTQIHKLPSRIQRDSQKLSNNETWWALLIFHQMLPGIFQSITGYYKDIRASPFQAESTLISSVPKHPSCWLYLSASPELTALTFAAVSLPWLCFTQEIKRELFPPKYNCYWQWWREWEMVLNVFENYTENI